ncbi:muts domain V-domain-containing protein, partial [Pilaira anomala]
MTITEGRGIAIEIGLCVFDVNSCEFIISQLADSQTFTRTLQKINLNDPQKIIVASSSMDHQLTGTINNEGGTTLCQWIQKKFPRVPIITLPRRYFNDDEGKGYINTYGLQEDVVGLQVGVSKKYFCLAAIAGTFHYLFENEGQLFAEHTIKFVYQGAEGTMLIDTITAKNLELVSNTTNSHTKNTLLGILDRTLTPMGKRLLRMNILQPPCSIDVIKDRLDAVENLSKYEESIFNIQSCLKQLTDLDYTVSFLAKVPSKIKTKNSITAVQHAEMKLNQIIALKQAVTCMQDIEKHLPQNVKEDNIEEEQILLSTIYKILSNSAFAEFEQLIDEYINQEVGVQKTSLGIRNQKCYAVKAGVNGLLDVARQTYKETTEDIYEMVSNYSQMYDMTMKLQFSPTGGFYITMASSQVSKRNGQLPKEFINVITKRKTLQFTTLELLQKNSRINESLTEVYLMSDRIVTELLQTFRDNINIFYKASEAISLLDMLTSLATCNISSDYVRPEFSDTMAIKAGRHPILDHILSFPLVPNDAFASLSSSFQFITGPNMSGKSTYLRQIALLAIMAQLGSFVPAEYASFRLSDQLLSRLANDNTFSDIGTSSFMSEMRETAYLLQHITNTSIVIIDELGRSTSPSDALGITGAVCEDLIRTRAFCFFATHLHELTRSLDVYPNVVNLQFKVQVTKHSSNNCTVDYQYRIEDGYLSSENHYGLQTAQILGFPQEVLSCAYKIVDQLKAKKAKHETTYSGSEKEITKERKLLWFADKMLQLGQAKMSKVQLREHLIKLQNDIWREEDNS